MGRHYIPRSDAAFLTWAKVFGQGIASDPEALGISLEQSAQYLLLFEQFAQAYAATAVPDTRTRPATEVKNSKRIVLEKYARTLAGIIRANPSVNAAQRVGLGLCASHPLEDGDGAAIDKPQSEPSIHVTHVDGRRAFLRVRDSDTSRRAKPRGCAGAKIFSFQGEQPSADINQWAFRGLCTRSSHTIEFDHNTSGGVPVWIAACWYSPRGKSGPMSNPARTFLACPLAKAA